MQRGKRELVAGDAQAAAAAFGEAAGEFGAASDGASAPWLRVAGWFPILGRTPDAVAAVAYAGQETSRAGQLLATAVANTPGGLAGLAPSEGRVPLERIQALADTADEAAGLVETAHRRVAEAPHEMLFADVDVALWEAERELSSLAGSLRAGATILERLPALLGADGPRRYFFGAENPAELRGTGGLIGAYSILTVRDGRFSFSPFRAIQSLPLLDPGAVEPPSLDYARNYNHYRSGNGFWLNANMTPHFPSAALAYEVGFEEVTGERIDGVIAADPLALQALLRATGPVRIPSLDLRVDADSVVALTTNEAYARFDDAETRKLVLGRVAQDVVTQFLDLPSPTPQSLRVIAQAATEGHITIYADDPLMQEGLEATGVGGGFPRPRGSFFSLIQNNGSGSKIDFYQEREIVYRVRLEDDGTALADAALVFTNQAPDSGQPRYVIGPFPGVSEAGENVVLVNLYCGTDCQLTDASRDGVAVELSRGIELGQTYYRDYLKVPSGGTARLETSLTIPDAWLGNTSGGEYRLTFLNQTTVRPTTLRVEISLPEGMEVVSTAGGLRAQGDLLVYEGTPDRILELEVVFRPPFLSRMWRNLERFLSEPVFRET